MLPPLEEGGGSWPAILPSYAPGVGESLGSLVMLEKTSHMIYLGILLHDIITVAFTYKKPECQGVK